MIRSLPMSGVTLGMVFVVLLGLCMYTDIPMDVYHFLTATSSDVKDEGWPAIPAVVIMVVSVMGLRRRRQRNKEYEEMQTNIRRIERENAKRWTSADDPHKFTANGQGW